MTDISNWPAFIERVTKTLNVGGWGKQVEPYEDTRIVVPLNEYQIANLLGLFVKMEQQQHNNIEHWNTGDWYYEVLSILAETCVKLGIKQTHANCFSYPFITAELEKTGWDMYRYDQEMAYKE